MAFMAHDVGEMLMQAPAESHVEYLDAPADRKQRQIGLEGPSSQGEFPLVTFPPGPPRLRMELTAVAGRVDVWTPRDDQPIDDVEQLVGLAREGR
jgi:hypothetical protein